MLDPVTSLVSGIAALGLLSFVWVMRHRAGQEADRAKLAIKRAEQEGAHLPPSLHPVIDTQICIGSLSCVSACPEGKILGIVDGAATLVRGAACIGHGRCALECPVDAIKLVFGSSERGVDLPEVDTHFQSSRPGVYIVGELGGMGLIKNAMIQGLQGGGRIAASLPKKSDDSVLDVVVVGAGPAGLACGIALSQANLKFEVLEQSALGGTVTVFPRHKVVMTEKVDLPGWGGFGKRLMSKEELIEGLHSLVQHYGLPVHEGVRVDAISGEDGAFTITSSDGVRRARKVVLAIGRRGTPRRLGVPGEDTDKVTYALIDPEQYRDKKVMIVGGGDSAVEAAVAVSAVAAQTQICYRKPDFNRCRTANREALKAAAESGALRILTESEVQQIAPKVVAVKTPTGTFRVDNDFVLVCAGGELPVGFLKRSGVSLERHEGSKGLHSPAAKPKKIEGQYVRTSAQQELAKTRRLSQVLWGVGVLVIGTLSYLGWDYYALTEELRSDSPMHELWRPAGDVGHGIGVIASLVMLSNFLYAMRKRLGFMKGTAPINRWLSFHVFVGLLSPAVIAFHAAFQSNNLIATGTFFSLLIVVGTGLVGRFIYGLVPRANGRIISKKALEDQQQKLRSMLRVRADSQYGQQKLQEILHSAGTGYGIGTSVVGLFVRYPLAWVTERQKVWRQRKLFPDPFAYTEYSEASHDLLRLEFQLNMYEALRRFLGWWRVLHVALALLLAMIMGAHIGVALYLGYGWILF